MKIKAKMGIINTENLIKNIKNDKLKNIKQK